MPNIRAQAEHFSLYADEISAIFELTPKHILDASLHIYFGYYRTKCLARQDDMYRVYVLRSPHIEMGELSDYLSTALEFVAPVDDEGVI